MSVAALPRRRRPAEKVAGDRFDAAAAWDRLPESIRRRIGEMALTLALSDLAVRLDDGSGTGTRPYQAAAMAALTGIAVELPRDLFGPPGATLPLPGNIGPICRGCGCSQHDACPPTCSWVEPDLCSACAPPAPRPWKLRGRRNGDR